MILWSDKCITWTTRIPTSHMSKVYRVARRLTRQLLQNSSPENHQKAKEAYLAYMKSVMGHFVTETDPGPLGDEDIILKTSVLSVDRVGSRLSSDQYFGSGYSTMLTWLQLLEQHSFNLRTASAIMEMGCGSARLIRHLRCVDGIRLLGCDVQAPFIEWCTEHIPGIEFYINEIDPPFTFLEDNVLDLIIAQSVFTHIPLDKQAAWIRELHRVLRPGGFAILNVLGRRHQELMLTPQDRERLKTEKQLTLEASHPQASYSTQLIGSWDVFQTRGEILNAFRTVFHICDYIPKHLDLLILKKPSS